MSWMDSWSRPSKSQATPPPLYLTQGDNARYCHTCGRLIGTRRINNSKPNKGGATAEVKYCSDKCKRHKPSTSETSIDKKIENALLALLEGRDPPNLRHSGDDDDSAAKPVPSKPKPTQKPKKGDPRILVSMSDIETAVFGCTHDPEKIYGRNKNRAKRGLPDPEEWTSVDMQDDEPAQVSPDLDEGQDHSNSRHHREGPPSPGDTIHLPSHVRPSQLHSTVNGSIGGEKGLAERITETPEMLQKRLEGQRRVENRELVRNAARRAVAFGLLPDNNGSLEGQRSKKTERKDEDEKVSGIRRKCEAVMNGGVVEPSFAKGDWGVRWRED